jgi:predicted unusual protein kinase regulating ubiquinone biosynthesis (AarF/ABC1/UbiB family)
VASAPRAMVSEWVSGRRLSDVIRSGTQAERGGAAAMLAEFHYSAPARVGLLHADPHPGNFQILDDGRLMVLDYGAVARLPDGLPRPLSIMVRLALENKPSELLQLLRDNGFLRAGSPLAAEEAVQYLAPFTEPLRTESFHFNRRWLQRQAERVGDLRRPEFRTGRELNLPPQYLLVHRVTMGTLGVLCQLDADVPLRGIVQHWQPWIFDANDETASRHA